MRFAENMTFEEKVRQAEAELYYMEDEDDRRYFAELAAKGRFGSTARPSEEVLAETVKAFLRSDDEIMAENLEWVRQRREEQKKQS